jgi:hypothetical protein
VAALVCKARALRRAHSTPRSRSVVDNVRRRWSKTERSES